LDALNRPQCGTKKANGSNTLSPRIAAVGQAPEQPKATKEGKKTMGEASSADIQHLLVYWQPYQQVPAGAISRVEIPRDERMKVGECVRWSS
jgi:hypothetical protein